MKDLFKCLKAEMFRYFFSYLSSCD